MATVRAHMARDLLTVDPALSLVEVARRMVERNVGAVLVLEGGELAAS